MMLAASSGDPGVISTLSREGSLGENGCTCGALKLFTEDPLMAQRGKNPPTMQETWIRSLGQEDPLEKKTATHSSVPV